MKWLNIFKKKPVEKFDFDCACCGNKTNNNKRICDQCHDEYMAKMGRVMFGKIRGVEK
jgi:hypothetical protein